MKRLKSFAVFFTFVAVFSLLISMFLATWILKNFELPAALRLAVAFLPIPPVILVLYTNARWLRACDELQQRIQLEALAFAFPVSFVGAYLFEYLRKAGFLSQWVMREAWSVMGLLLAVSYLIGYLVAQWRYR